jgi:hypothetical protein
MTRADGSGTMEPSLVEPRCPQCHSLELTFLEHGAGGAVFRCEECGRATIQRWIVAPVPPPPKPRATLADAFPAWFLGRV